MRSLVAVTAASIVAIVAYWCAAVVALLTMHGIPLGSAGGPPTAADISVHLALAALASFGGCLVAFRIARTSPHLHAWAVGAVLAIGAIAGFGKPSSQWPAWFSVGMAASCSVGAIAASRWRMRRR